MKIIHDGKEYEALPAVTIFATLFGAAVLLGGMVMGAWMAWRSL